MAAQTQAELVGLVRSLTTDRVAEAERVDRAETSERECRETLRVLREDHNTLQISHRARSISLDAHERECRALRRRLDTVADALQQVCSAGGRLTKSVDALRRTHPACQTPPALHAAEALDIPAARVATQDHAVSDGLLGAEASAIANANLGTVLNAYTTTAELVEALTTAVHSLEKPVSEFRVASEAASNVLALPPPPSASDEERRRWGLDDEAKSAPQ